MSAYLLFTFWVPAVWALFILASWVGYGTLVARALHGDSRARTVDWGLRAGWGMALTLAIGGVLLAVHEAFGNILCTIVLVGAFIGSYDFYEQRQQQRKATPFIRKQSGRLWWYAPAALLAVLVFAGTILTLNVNVWDDLMAYFLFAKRIVTSGTLIEPFSWRRLSTYGGQQLFQAMMLPFGNESNLSVIDNGLGLPVMMGLAVGIYGRHRTRRERAISGGIALLVGLVSIPRMNSQSQTTGVILFLTLFRTMVARTPKKPGSWWYMPVWIGVIAGAIGTLRMNFLPAAGLMLLLWTAMRWRRNPAKRPAAIREGAIAVGLMGVTLLPWAINLFESSRSLFYPLMVGNHRPEQLWILQGTMTVTQKIKTVGRLLIDPTVLALFVPLPLLLWSRSWRPLLSLWICAVFLTVATTWAFSNAALLSQYRYAFPLLWAADLATIAMVLRQSRHQIVLTIVAIAVILIANSRGAGSWTYYTGQVGEIATTFQAEKHFAQREVVDDYAHAQQAVPAGAKIMVFVESPTLLDLARNPIDDADEPGVASPDPGMPIYDGSEALRKYLLAQGYNYVIAANPSRGHSQYQRVFWADLARAPENYPTMEVIAKRAAFDYVRVMDLLDGLVATQNVIYHGRMVDTIDLRDPPMTTTQPSSGPARW